MTVRIGVVGSEPEVGDVDSRVVVRELPDTARGGGAVGRKVGVGDVAVVGVGREPLAVAGGAAAVAGEGVGREIDSCEKYFVRKRKLKFLLIQ